MDLAHVRELMDLVGLDPETTQVVTLGVAGIVLLWTALRLAWKGVNACGAAIRRRQEPSEMGAEILTELGATPNVPANGPVVASTESGLDKIESARVSLVRFEVEEPGWLSSKKGEVFIVKLDSQDVTGLLSKRDLVLLRQAYAAAFAAHEKATAARAVAEQKLMREMWVDDLRRGRKVLASTRTRNEKESKKA